MAEKKTTSISTQIARRVFLLGGRMLSAKPSEVPMIQAAIGIYNHAQTISTSNPREAKKLFALAKRVEKRELKPIKEGKGDKRKR